MTTFASRRATRRLTALGLGCLASVLIGACATAAVGGAPPSPTPLATIEPTRQPTTRPASTPRPTPTGLLGSLDAGGSGWSLAKAGDALWIQVDPPVDAIVRIDIATGESKPVVPLGHKVKFGSEGLWVLGGGWLARVDPVTGAEMVKVPMGGGFALADGAVWLYNERGLHRIEPATGRIGKPIGPDLASVCVAPKDLLIAFESAWVACKEGKVVRVELSNGDLTRIETETGAHTLAMTDDAVWVTNYQAGSVSRIGAKSNDVTTIPGAGSGVGIVVGDGYVWAAAPAGIAKIDPTTASIVGTIPLGEGQYYDLVWDDGIIWTSTRGSRVLKVDPAQARP